MVLRSTAVGAGTGVFKPMRPTSNDAGFYDSKLKGQRLSSGIAAVYSPLFFGRSMLRPYAMSFIDYRDL